MRGFAYRRLSWDFCCCSSTYLLSSNRPLCIQISLTVMDGAQYCPLSLVQACCCHPAVRRWPSATRDETSQWKTAQPRHTYSGTFHRDHRSGCVLWIFGWLTAQKYFTDDEVHSEMLWEHPASLQYHHLSYEAVLYLEQCGHAWEQVVLSYLSLGFYLGPWYEVQCSPMLAVWKEVLAGASELMSEAAQGGAEVSPPLPFHFQCVFYSPAKHGHPHPVPTTH